MRLLFQIVTAVGIVFGVIFGGLFALGVYLNLTDSDLIQHETSQIEKEQTCVELMDMDFKSEQECIEFSQALLGKIEGKLDDPKVQELLKNYKP